MRENINRRKEDSHDVDPLSAAAILGSYPFPSLQSDEEIWTQVFVWEVLTGKKLVRFPFFS